MLAKLYSRILQIISIACLIFTLTGCFYETHDYIFANSYKKDSCGFDFTVENLRTCVTGATYEFKAVMVKEELFEKFATENELFERKDNLVSVIYENEIFTLKHLSKNNYVLHSEYIMWNYNDEFYYIPFPTGRVLQNESNIPRIMDDSFEIQNIDYEYFERFYSVYQEIDLIDNQIVGLGFVLELPDAGDKGIVRVNKTE